MRRIIRHRGLHFVCVCLCLSVVPLDSSADTLLVESVPADFSKPKTILLNFTQTDIRDVLQAIAIQQNVNIVPDRDVTGPVDIHIKAVPLDDALELLCTTNGLTYSLVGNTYRISKVVENPFVRFVDNKLTIYSNNVDLRQILSSISRATGLSINTTKPIDAKITTYINDQPAESAIAKILFDNGFTFERENNVYTVSPVMPPYRIEYGQGKVTVEAKAADLKELINAMAKKAYENIVVDEDVKATVTVTLTDVDFFTGLQSILNTYNLAIAKYQNIYRVYRQEAGVRLPISMIGGRITMDVRDAELQMILTQVTTLSGMNLITYGRLSDRINARYIDVPLDEALKQMLAGTNYEFKFDKNTLIVGSAAVSAKESKQFITEKKVRLNFIRTEDLFSLLSPGLPQSNFKLLPDLNSVIVYGTEEFIASAEKAIAMVDESMPQIEVEVLVVEVSRSKSQELGLVALKGQTKKISATFTQGATALTGTYSGVGTLSRQFDFTLAALEQEGVAKILARPHVLARNKRTARINVGSQINVRITTPSSNASVPLSQVQSIPSGISLQITPWTTPGSDTITVSVSAEVSSASGQGSASELPTISTRRAETEASLGFGQTMVLGGLINTQESKGEDRTPWLGRIPILKWAFKKEATRENTTELIFYVTPKRVTTGDTTILVGSAR